MRNQKSVQTTYVERDVSWMYFNRRILQEAEKKDVPLLERLSFLGIYSNNLDEFFRVRVASLNRILEVKNLQPSIEKTIKDTLRTIGKLNETYNKEYERVVSEVIQELEQHKIKVITERQITEEQRAYIYQLYFDMLNGSTNPIWLSKINDLSTLEDNRIYLVVKKKHVHENKVRYAIIKIPDRLYGRFFKIPFDDGYTTIMYLDDLIRVCLPQIFIGSPESTYEAYSMKFTKDAEMDIDNEGDYGTMRKIAIGVDSRKKGEPIRVLYDNHMPEVMQEKVLERMNIKPTDTLLGSGRYQNHKDLMKFPDCGHDELKYPKWAQVMKPEFKSRVSMLTLIREKDRFIHVPYHSFDAYIRLLREAALSSDVKSIKTTLYRLAKDSKVVKALICAAQNGKQVTVVIELLARFDEESNIMWAKRMQEEGVKVIFGVEGLKIHSKLLYLSCKNGDIACIGTGNFHEGNAKTYTDYLLMTAETNIVREVSKVFDFIKRPFSHVRFRELLVSPNSMRRKILHMINVEIKNAKMGKEAWIKIKINHITDKMMVNKLYAASEAGVKIGIVLRGNNSLVPGIKGLSDNIHAVGIIDRYLEHSRILIFSNGGRPVYYLGSADWMPRNLDHRIEVMAPVYDEDLQKDLLRTVDFGLNDTMNGRLITGFGSEEIQQPLPGKKPFRSQEQLYFAYRDEAQ